MSMNVAVQSGDLERAVAERGPGAYVLTVSDDGRPHAVYAPTRWEGGRLAADVGATTARNARARPEISLLFPVRAPSDYSLLVDGVASVAEERPEGRRILLTPTRAVLHRPGTPATPTACGSDCVPIDALHRA